MGTLTLVAIGLLVLVVIGLGINGTISAAVNGYSKLESNPTVQIIQSQAVSQVISHVTPEIKKLTSELTTSINVGGT
jgi:sensor domain CHASE-containing protein